jgi:hypothetical protein
VEHRRQDHLCCAARVLRCAAARIVAAWSRTHASSSPALAGRQPSGSCCPRGVWAFSWHRAPPCGILSLCGSRLVLPVGVRLATQRGGGSFSSHHTTIGRQRCAVPVHSIKIQRTVDTAKGTAGYEYGSTAVLQIVQCTAQSSILSRFQGFADIMLRERPSAAAVRTCWL